MAFCVEFNALSVGSSTATLSGSSQPAYVAVSYGRSSSANGQYTCASGSYLVMSVAEVNAMPKSGVPDGQLMQQHFFMALTLILTCYVVSKLVGSVLQMVRKG